VFHVSIRGFGALFGGLSQSKFPRDDGTGSTRKQV